MYYINTLKQEFSIANIYEHNLFKDRYIVDMHQCHIASTFGVIVDEDHSKLAMLPKLHKIPYKSRFIAYYAHVLLYVVVYNFDFLALMRFKNML